MNLNDYQTSALTTTIRHTDPLMDKTIYVLGIAGEAGEVVEKWKKIVAYTDGKVTDDQRTELTKELGDVLWYLAVFADSLGVSLEEIGRINLDKLASRKVRGTQKGAGDNR